LWPSYLRIGTRDVTQPDDDGPRIAPRVVIGCCVLLAIILVVLVIALLVRLPPSRKTESHSGMPPTCNPQALTLQAEVGDSASTAPRRPGLVFNAAKDCRIDGSIVLTHPGDQKTITRNVHDLVTHNGFTIVLPPEWDWCNGPSHLVVQNREQPTLERELPAPDQCPHK
jgi:hypothetical protein